MNEKLSFKNTTYFGSGLLSTKQDLPSHVRTEEGENGALLVSVLDAPYIHPHELSTKTPQWWEKLVEQAEEVNEKGDASTVIMRLPDDSYLITGKYSESFYQWLHSLESGGFFYDRFIGGIVIENPTWTEDTNKRLSSNHVIVTKHAASYIAPLTKRSEELAAFAEQAEKEGFEEPSKKLFPSKLELMPHQKPVVKALAKRGGGILADDVGSGKSSMFINAFFCLAQYLVKEEEYCFDDCFPVVAVTKVSLVDNTVSEFEKWFEGIRVHSIRGKKDAEIPPGTQAIVISLNSLGSYLDVILDQDPKGVVFDESHMVKSMDAKRTQAAMALAEYIKESNDFPFITAVSATPMPNRPAELWSQLEITGMSDPIIDHIEKKQSFPPRTKIKYSENWTVKMNDNLRFDIRYCKGRPGRFGWDNKGSSNEMELADLLYENGFIRRKKFEFITPLPPLYQDFVYCDISDEDMQRYKIAEEQFKDHLVRILREKSRKEKWSRKELATAIEEKLSKAQTSEAIMKMTSLRQMVGEIKIPGIVEWIHLFFNQDPRIVGKKGSQRKKLIVFAHHKSVQKMLIEHPELQKYGVLSITANTKNVGEIVDEFQAWNSGKNLIICYSGASDGLTLTAAQDVLITELPFSSYTITQMAGRCWSRISQDYPPHEGHVHYAVSGLNIDNYLSEMIRSKAWLSHTIIDGEKAIDAINDAESGEISENDGATSVMSSFFTEQ